MDLPSEVVRLICAQLCPHCRGVDPSEECPGDYQDWPALLALSRTCTVLRDIAQPLVYHLPGTLNLDRLLRNLRARPDLAACVKWFPFNHMPIDLVAKCFAQDGFALIKEMAAELQMLTPEDAPFDEEFADMLVYLANGRDHTKARYDCFFQIAQFKTLLHAILVASFPCLETLRIESWQDGDHHEPVLNKFAQRRLERVGRMVSDQCAGTSMPSLHTVTIDDWRNHSWSWELEDSPNYDKYSNIHLDPREFLLSYATSLKQIIFTRCEAPYEWPAASRGAKPATLWSTLPDLTAVEFTKMAWGACEIDERLGVTPVTEEEQDTAYARIAQMVEECTALISFKMSVRCVDQPRSPNTFSPSRLLQSLMPAASRLETLEINAEMVNLQKDSAVLVGVGLHSFTKLQRLSLNENCFCSHRLYGNYNGGLDPFQPWDQGEGEYPHVCRANRCLVEALPKSVTSLNIRLGRKPLAIPDILCLGNAAVDGQFPNLVHITVEAYLMVPKERLQEGRHWTSISCFPEGDPVEDPNMQPLAPKLAEAFHGSGVTAGVKGIPIL